MKKEYTVRDKLVSSIGKDFWLISNMPILRNSSIEWIVYFNTRVVRV